MQTNFILILTGFISKGVWDMSVGIATQ